MLLILHGATPWYTCWRGVGYDTTHNSAQSNLAECAEREHARAALRHVGVLVHNHRWGLKVSEAATHVQQTRRT